MRPRADRTEPKFKVPHLSRCIDEQVATPRQNFTALAVALIVVGGGAFILSKLFWWWVS
jgi:hypothetical protein